MPSNAETLFAAYTAGRNGEPCPQYARTGPYHTAWQRGRIDRLRDEQLERDIDRAEQAIEDGQARWAETGSTRRR